MSAAASESSKYSRANADFTWVLEFTPELAKLTARDFAKIYFAERLSIRGLVMGFDSRFGSDRMNRDSPTLQPLAQVVRRMVRFQRMVRS